MILYLLIIFNVIYLFVHFLILLDGQKATSSFFCKKGDLGIAKKYRGSSMADKIYIALLLNRIEPEIEKILRKNQNGFQRNTSTTSQILTIRRILEGVKL